MPAYFVQAASGHDFAKDLLLNILAPTVTPDKEGRLMVEGATRHLGLASKSKNQEDPGFAGSARSKRLFQNEATYGDKITKPTPFIGRIVSLVDAVDQNRRAQIIETISTCG